MVNIKRMRKPCALFHFVGGLFTYLARLNQNDRSRAECLRRTGVDSQAPLHSKVGPEPSSYFEAANN